METNIDRPYIVFDLESQGLLPWYGHMVTCICAKDSTGVNFGIVNEGDEERLILSFLEWLSLRDSEAYLLITKNGKQADVPWILARAALLSQKKNSQHCLSVAMHLLNYDHFDLHEITKRWVSLDDMAKLLCCEHQKSGKGEDAIKLFEEGRLEELQWYCRQDVLVTEEVYLRWLSLGKNAIEQHVADLQRTPHHGDRIDASGGVE